MTARERAEIRWGMAPEPAPVDLEAFWRKLAEDVYAGRTERS